MVSRLPRMQGQHILMGKAEGKIEGALVKRIEQIGGEIRKACWIGRRGCPDRFVMLPGGAYSSITGVLEVVHDLGRSCWVEVKSPTGTLDGHQEREHKRMRALGELVLVVSSQDDIDRYFPLTLPE